MRFRPHAVLLGLLLLGATALLLPRGLPAAAPVVLTPAEQQVRGAVQGLWQALDTDAAAGRAGALAALFDLHSAAGAASLRHAEARLAFVQAWARARGVRWLTPEVSVRTPSIRFQGAAQVQVTAIISEAWAYTYGPAGTPPGAVHRFGLGREHYMTLRLTAGGWRIAQDWFTDPLDQDTRIPGEALPAAPTVPSGTVPGGPVARALALLPGRAYNREGAVRYANTYCGAAPGCGNGGRYNPRLYNYNGEGGDCTNFVSQALNLGGGLRRSADWTFDPRSGEGTPAWVKAPTLLGHLLAAGLGRVVARGTYTQVAAAVASLSPGDVIGYIEKGDVVHLALVAGFDQRGYALVDSHTADRFQVPWDIGWDRGARYVLVHVSGRVRARPAALSALLPGPGTGCGFGAGL